MRNKYALLCESCAPKEKDYVTPAIGVATGLCQICGAVVGASGCGYEWVPIAIARDTAAKRGLKFNEYGDGYTVTHGLVHPDGVTQIHPDSVELIIAICKEHEMPMLASFQYAKTEDDALCCTTALLREEWGTQKQLVAAANLIKNGFAAITARVVTR